MTSTRLYIPVGIPGCGKSTFAERLGLASYPGKILSSDAIRAEMGDVNDQTNNEEVFRRFHGRINWYLGQNGVDVYADATNLDSRSRQTLRDIAGRYDFVTSHVILFNNLHQALARNAQRERRVPDEVMGRMLMKWERASREVYTEFYDSVTVIDSVD